MPHKAAPTLLQLETRPRSRGNRCLYAELGSISKVRQSSMVSDKPLPVQAEETNSTNDPDNTIVENSTMVPTTSGTLRGLALEDTSPARSNVMPQGQDFLLQQGHNKSPGLSQAILYIMRTFLASFRPHACIMERQN